jgi:Flp pilus assembly protein TadG
MAIVKKIKDIRGQMTVELCVVFPVLIVVALIGINAMSFFEVCASFDRQARNTVRLIAASPASNVDNSTLATQVESALSEKFDSANTSVEVTVYSGEGFTTTFDMKIKYSPTLFGIGIRDSVFGVSLPVLSHTVEHKVEIYRVGESLTTIL